MGFRSNLKDQIRSALIQAGMNLFMEQTFTKTTIDQITSAAGVAKGTFYNYFSTKEDLLVAGLLIAQRDAAAGVSAEVLRLPTVAERLKRFCQCAIDWMTAYPELCMVWCLERMRRGLARTNSEFDLLLTQVIAEGQASGELRNDHAPEQMTLEVEGILLAYVAAWYHGGLTLDLTAAMSKALDTYLSGARSQTYTCLEEERSK